MCVSVIKSIGRRVQPNKWKREKAIYTKQRKREKKKEEKKADSKR